MNTAFKQTQILPLLTAEMIGREGSNRTFCPQCARVEPRRQTRASATALSTRLPRPQAGRDPAELALLTVLSASAAFCLGHAAFTLVTLMPHWSNFQNWVAQLIS